MGGIRCLCLVSFMPRLRLSAFSLISVELLTFKRWFSYFFVSSALLSFDAFHLLSFLCLCVCVCLSLSFFFVLTFASKWKVVRSVFLSRFLNVFVTFWPTGKSEGSLFYVWMLFLGLLLSVIRFPCLLMLAAADVCLRVGFTVTAVQLLKFSFSQHSQLFALVCALSLSTLQKSTDPIYVFLLFSPRFLCRCRPFCWRQLQCVLEKKRFVYPMPPFCLPFADFVHCIPFLNTLHLFSFPRNHDDDRCFCCAFILADLFKMIYQVVLCVPSFPHLSHCCVSGVWSF